MRHTDIRLSDCETQSQCHAAITSIEDDPANCSGDWFSGGATPLTAAAQKKVDALLARAERLPCESCGQTADCNC